MSARDAVPDLSQGVLADVIAEAKRNGNFELLTTSGGHTIGLFARGGPGALEAAKQHVREEIARNYRAKIFGPPKR